MGTVSPTPDFFRGDELSDWCDFIAPGQDDACDGRPEYEVRWRLAPCDLGRPQVSAVCLVHGHRVPREHVEKIQTLAAASR